VPHPIAAGNRLEGRDCQGWRFVPSRSDATGGSALDWPVLEGAPMSWSDQVSCCVCWPGVRRRAVKAEPALTPGRGGAQRSRLDSNTAQFGNAMQDGRLGQCAESFGLAA
jgi:hypothetical protein